jgi:hypothetical protein
MPLLEGSTRKFQDDTKRLIAHNEARGWRGIYAWEHREYTGYHRDPNIVLEAVASRDL